MRRSLSHARPTKAARGFTLLEMLVVLVIIGLIAGLVGPQLMGRVETSKVMTAQTQVKLLKSALDTMRLDIGRYPTKEEGLDMLVTAPKEPRAAARWQGPYLAEGLPPDPWSNPYQYLLEGSNTVILYSYGADGRAGGEGTDADVGMLPRGTTTQQAAP